MSASYVSARFEKTDLSTSLGKYRCIVRNRDDGSVPPLPSPIYAPTSPDTLRNSFVIEYVGDTVGERFSRVAELNDINTLVARRLTAFECYTADFVAAGVIPGDVLELRPPNALEWQSEEYPGSPFYFTVTNVPTAQRLELASPIPSFLPSLTWAIATKASGTQSGFPRREGFPPGTSTFLDSRYNALFDSIPSLETFVTATKMGLDILATTSSASSLSSETYSSGT